MGRRLLAVLGVLLVLAAIGLFILYLSQRVPEFYREALTADTAVQKKGSEMMVQQATTLNSDARRPGRWEAVFTAEEVNGWLAVELPATHADALPPEMSDPRVAIQADGVTLACRVQRGGFSSVVTLKVDVYMESANVVALRVRKVRVGAIPWKLDQVLQGIAKAAQRAELQLQWRQADGDPVAFITLHLQERGKSIKVEKIQLEDDAIRIFGITERQR
jgi:hypothetical protein